MCLVAFAFRSHPLFPLVLAANRDEFFARPAAPIGWWDDAPHILAGRDLQSGGTWLGVGPGGRIAALTNYRDPRLPRNAATSRGDLAARFLDGGYPPDRFAEFLQGNGHIYSPFTLLFGTAASLHVYSNVTGLMLEVAAGVHALSNHQLDTPWPKVLAASRGLKSILEAEHAAAEGIAPQASAASEPDRRGTPRTGEARRELCCPASSRTGRQAAAEGIAPQEAGEGTAAQAAGEGIAPQEAGEGTAPQAAGEGIAPQAAGERNRILVEALFRLLSDRTPAADADLPDTGVGLDAERGLSPIFVHIPATGYGTRCSTVLLVDPHGHGCMTERTHAAAGPCDVERCF
jgi:uncharacterized protein with NRDE domain